jgi:hypothetical protein
LPWGPPGPSNQLRTAAAGERGEPRPSAAAEPSCRPAGRRHHPNWPACGRARQQRQRRRWRQLGRGGAHAGAGVLGAGRAARVRPLLRPGAVPWVAPVASLCRLRLLCLAPGAALPPPHPAPACRCAGAPRCSSAGAGGPPPCDRPQATTTRRTARRGRASCTTFWRPLGRASARASSWRARS